MPAPIQNFDGLDFSNWGAGYPPDTVGDVGPNHYIQAVNTSIGIFSKTGTPLAAVTFDTLWDGAGTGTPCDGVPVGVASTHNGDPTVVYDPMGNRFFVADFAWSDFEDGPYYECIAVSKTGDPVAGGWWLYAIRTDDATHPWLADYPKMGIWPDGLYMTANMFDITPVITPFEEVRVWAFDRTDMEAGLPAVDIRIVDLNSTSYFTLLPSHYTGTPPPGGRENLLASESEGIYAWEVWKFHADFSGGGSTFTGPTNVSQASYPCCNFPDVQTPSVFNDLDSLADRLMMQNQYKNVGGAESLWVTHTVPVNIPSGPEVSQWAQIDVTGGTITLTPVQEQIYNVGDGLNRWMSSLAVDKTGNMALGYSVADRNTNPQIRYSGRLLGDPAGTLGQGEATLIAGGGTQTNNCGGAPCHRWGDYSAMTLDPDGCTFWYTTEYYATDGGNWKTRMGSFAYPVQNCNPTTAVSVRRLDAVRTKKGVSVTWRTASETEILGFNVFRTRTGTSRIKVNPALIPAKHSGQAGGAAYRVLDRTAKAGRGYTYRLQIVDLRGARSWYSVGAAAR
jgi:hypothetical protein